MINQVVNQKLNKMKTNSQRNANKKLLRYAKMKTKLQMLLETGIHKGFLHL